MSNGRDQKGRFGKNNPGGPGRPCRATEHEYLEALGEAVSLAQWRKLTARAVTDAIKGDGAARNWLSKYLLPEQPRTMPVNEAKAGASDEIIKKLSSEDVETLARIGHRLQCAENRVPVAAAKS